MSQYSYYNAEFGNTNLPEHRRHFAAPCPIDLFFAGTDPVVQMSCMFNESAKPEFDVYSESVTRLTRTELHRD